ncbi:MAG: methylmalonyl Co-A mutase-associated GTPase MeaB [Chloroflexi bacterium]|nr:methylmalonyl Co-A mutase-associated GTPase MeaB [Chloroflexota bacterium]
MSLADSVLNGDRLALARVLTQIENDTPDGRAALDLLFPRTGKAHLIGVTGAPGTGKSSLVNRLALHFRTQNKRVAIVAVDPSSPFTGGAVLGDRVRMKDLSGDNGVFIRSMASRGSLGGLAQATAGMVQVFDAAGYDVIMIETVGAGQSEVDIARLAHTTLVVEAPGLGDDIQAIKAGILEIADILVVNKADRPGVENTEKALKSMLELAHPTQRVYSHHGKYMSVALPIEANTDMWIPPIVKTIATEGNGIPELAEQISKHAEHLRISGDWAARERARLESEMETALQEKLMSQFRERVPQVRYDEIMRQVFERNLSPGEAVKLLTNGRTK